MVIPLTAPREPADAGRKDELLDELELRSPEEEKPPRSEAEASQWLQSLFLFALCWSVGGNLDGESRVKFSDFLKVLAAGTNKEYQRFVHTTWTTAH